MIAPSPVASVMACTSAEAVAALLRLFFPTARRLLDASHGAGAFWKGPAAWGGEVIGLDRNPRRAKELVGDFTALPFADASFDVVAFDPPHLTDAGTASLMRARYGSFPTLADREAAVRAGLRECRRVARLGVLAKVANPTHAGRPTRMTRWREEELADAFEVVLVRPKGGKIEDGRWREQRTPRTVDARLLVWPPAGRRRRVA